MKNKWVFSYNSGASAYDEFSQYQDADNLIAPYLQGRYDFSGKIVAEIGCGSGKFTGKLARLCKEYYALDKSASMIKLARQRHGHLPNVRFITQSAEHLPFQNAALDILFGSWALTSMGDMDEQRRVMAEIKRTLKQEGLALLVENHWQSEFTDMLGMSVDYDKSTIKPLVEEFGFLIEIDFMTNI